MTIAELRDLAHYAVTGTVPAEFENKTVDVNKAFADGLNELAGDWNSFQRNKYDIFEILIKEADEIVPRDVIAAVSPFAEVQVVPNNTKAIFRRKLGRARAKQFLTQVGLNGVYETFRLDNDTFELGGRAIGGGVSIDYDRMITGAESLQEMLQILTDGLTNAVYVEIQRALRAAIDNTERPDANKHSSNAFDADAMFKLISVVKAYGTGAIIFATPEFVGAMGADAIVPIGTFGDPASAGYHGIYSPDDIEAIHRTGYINLFRGTPIVQIPQSFIDENNEKTWIDPQLAYIFPTGAEKIVKVVLEGPTEMWDWVNKDRSIEIMAQKKMGCAILSHHNWAIYQNTGITQTYDQPYGNI